MAAPNQVWCADFKGQFKTRDGRYCYPLTVTDGYSRYLLGCQGLLGVNWKPVQKAFDRIFQKYGMPRAIRTDNGLPFAASGAGGLTQLSVWWMKLGIRLERIAPGRPDQNGRHERMHRTLKQETVLPPRSTVRNQQRAFDDFRFTYNHERPHEALDQKPPATVYRKSSRRFDSKLGRCSLLIA